MDSLSLEERSDAPRTVLAVDIGTSGCRAISCRRDGTVLSQAQRSYGFTDDDQGCAEQDPDRILDCFVGVTKECLAGAGGLVDCVAVGSVLHSLMLLDRDGNPLTPLSIWADTRAADQCRRLREIFERNRWHEKSGCLLSPTYPVSRLSWFREQEPALYRKFHKAVSIKSYVHYRLFGRYLEDHSVASGSGMFNIHTRCWDEEILEYLGLDRERLPETVPVEYRLPGRLVSGCRDVLGLSEGTRWMVGGADGLLAHLGSAGSDSNVASITIGTSGAVRMQVANPGCLPGSSLWCYASNGCYISGRATNNGGNVVDWYLNAFLPGTGWQEVEKKLDASAFDAELHFLPFLFRERDMIVSDRSSAQFIGLKHWHTPDDLLRAVVEGVVFNVISMLDTLRSTYGAIEAVAVSGGFAQLDFVREILSAVLTFPVRTASTSNASLLGLVRMVIGCPGFMFGEEASGAGGGPPRLLARRNGQTGGADVKAYLGKYLDWKKLSTSR